MCVKYDIISTPKGDEIQPNFVTFPLPSQNLIAVIENL